MASSVGTLRARLGLDAKPFERGLTGARGRMAAFAKGMARSVALAGAAMAAAAVAGGAALTKQSLTFIDEQAKVARTIDSSITALRALQMAAGDAGVGPDVLNQSMQKLGVRLVEAKVKGGAAGEALKRMGLDAETLLKMDGDARLGVIADRVKELGLSAAQTSQFLLEMGIENKEMALLLAGGGDAIRAARKEVEDLGLGLSAIDAGKVEAANDAMSRIKLVTEAVGNRLAVALAPALQSVAEGFTASMREGGLFRSMIDGISGRIASFLSLTSDLTTIISAFFQSFQASEEVEGRLAKIGEFFSLIMAPINAVVSGTRTVISWIAAAIRTTGSWGGAMGLLSDVAQEVWQRIGDGADYVRASIAVMTAKASAVFLGGMAKLSYAWVNFTQTIAEGMNSLFGTNLTGASAFATQELIMSSRAAEAAAASAGAAANKAAASFKAPLQSLVALQAAIKGGSDAATNSLEASTEAASDFNSAMSKGGSGTGSGGGGAADAVGVVKGRVDDLKDSMSGLKSTMGSAFTSLVTGAKSLKTVIGELLGKFAEMAANAAFEGLWGAGLSSVLGGGKKKASGGGFLSNIFAGFFDGGGSIPSGKFGIAGEYGPEFIRGPAMVTSRADTARIMGGSPQSVNVSVNVDGARGDEHIIGLVRQGVSQGMAQVRKEVPGLMSSHQKRNG